MYRLRVLYNYGHSALHSSRITCRRAFSEATAADVRARLLADLKSSMKTKDTFASTTIRSILAEVYNADKASSDEKISSSAITSLIRKAAARRADSTSQFIQASRPDLAEKEQREAEFLSSFLPPLLPEADVDRVLREVISEQSVEAQSDPRKALGKVFKAFYSKVDKSTVDPGVVKRRAETLLTN
ncbi:hypothetical protein EW146_g4998 [Bondarzewia mesenterica]|uniref:Altered inheritance of mitochondria protein 41 n=1 Tax=Bondarzewia mesenterica TaxID=1095465 RepID=A0A4V3XEY8_9AGAM|nr:hypothetical protein EW146_g4998 [Bondarzewia mesenterica]